MPRLRPTLLVRLGLGQQVQVLLARRHGVNDRLLATRKDQNDGLQQPRVGVEPESQFPLWQAVTIKRFDPERPLSCLYGVLGRRRA